MPHIMMKYKFLFFALVAFVFVSCDLNTVASPTVDVSRSHYRTTAAGVKDTITYTDSLNIGDTVLVPILCDGRFDYLRMVKIGADTTKLRVSLLWDEKFQSCLTADADPEHGCLAFKADSVYRCYTSIKYIPKASGTHRIDIVLLSAAKEGYSNGAWHFNVAVK